jgi:hypothetical protein
MRAVDESRAAEAARLYASGMTSREAGAAVGADSTTVIKWLAGLGVETRRKGPRGRADVPDRLILEMRDDEGMTFAEIGRATGMSRRGAGNRYRAIRGIPRPDRITDPAEAARLAREAELRAQGYRPGAVPLPGCPARLPESS